MSKIERCDYLDLLCYQWTEEGLPASIDAIAKIIGYKKGAQIPIAVLEKFPLCEDGRRRNARLETIRADQRERIQKRRRGAEETNRKRWGERVASDNGSDPADGVADESPPPTTYRGRSPLRGFQSKTPTPSARGAEPSGEPQEPDAIPLADLQRRLGAIFGRRQSTQWDAKEIKALRQIAKTVSEPDLQRLEWYYKLQIPKDSDIRRRSLATLLNNFNGELDRSRKFKEPSHY